MGRQEALVIALRPRWEPGQSLERHTRPLLGIRFWVPLLVCCAPGKQVTDKWRTSHILIEFQKDNSIITYFFNEVELLVLIPVASTVKHQHKIEYAWFWERGVSGVKMCKALVYTNAFNCRNRLQNRNWLNIISVMIRIMLYHLWKAAQLHVTAVSVAGTKRVHADIFVATD